MVKLRPKSLGDAYRDYLWGQDPELAELDASYPLSLPFSEYYKLYAQALKSPDPGVHHFAIETSQGDHIGNCIVYNIDEDKGEGELGIMIGNRAYWDKGYGTAAIQLLLDFVFTHTKLNRVFLHTLPSNQRAQRCFQKCGFIPYGYRQKGGRTFLLMEVNRDYWQKAKATPSSIPHQPTPNLEH
jgi:RimJ/RimL family protein N-acetyltransferase